MVCMKVLLSRWGGDGVIFGRVLTKWKDAPCPPGPALLQCALFLGDPLAGQAGREMCSQVRSGPQLLLVAFIYNLPFTYNFRVWPALEINYWESSSLLSLLQSSNTTYT